MPIFDRFIRYEWAEHALALALNGDSPSELRTWLAAQGLGAESARRTANLLTHLWFPSTHQGQSFRQEAFALYSSSSWREHLALHWGMALWTFPTFHETIRICGRLLHLQGWFYRKDVVNRVLEKHSNQSTIKRAAERILQTLTDWKVLEKSKHQYCLSSPVFVERPELAAWIFRSLLETTPEQYILKTDLLAAGEFFPFHFVDSTVLFQDIPQFVLLRNSDGDELVGLQST
ncbi:MAG: hypothetical protein D6694_05280 [Gammaproteobacteria bacterium]|nr:MAG: hypothetical protein D6694_05280 [Gammaproteobacteria bacterium]